MRRRVSPMEVDARMGGLEQHLECMGNGVGGYTE
jgi:hypothetical protein